VVWEKWRGSLLLSEIQSLCFVCLCSHEEEGQG
jgi:hypothetical protein